MKGLALLIFCSELCSRDKNIEALYHVIMVMIAVSLLYSMLLDTVEAGK